MKVNRDSPDIQVDLRSLGSEVQMSIPSAKSIPRSSVIEEVNESSVMLNKNPEVAVKTTPKKEFRYMKSNLPSEKKMFKTRHRQNSVDQRRGTKFGILKNNELK